MDNEAPSEIGRQWAHVCDRIRLESHDIVLNRWLDQMTPEVSDSGEILLSVPTRFMHEWMKEKEYDTLICSLWKEEHPSVKSVSMKIQTHKFKLLPTENATLNPTVPIKDPSFSSELETTYLDPHLTFENYVVGKTNEFAFAAAKRIAEMESMGFNPLYLHSSAGLGKTHLMQAIVAHIKKTKQNRKVLYLSAEKFMYQFVKALRFDETVSFRDLFRSVDILMIDDVQFICGKKATQEEFFHTFNALIEQGKQIVLSSDSSPLDLKGIDDRLKTRMAQGLVVDIYPTTYEMRIGILQSKANLLKTSVPQNVIEFLAQKITTNVRELEGALKRIVANTQFLGAPITLATTQHILKDLLNVYEKEISVVDIQRKVAEYYTIRLADLKSTRKDRQIVRPRQIAMYLTKVLTTQSLPHIGSAFERDHTTIIHAVKTIEGLLKTDVTLSDDIMTLKQGLRG